MSSKLLSLIILCSFAVIPVSVVAAHPDTPEIITRIQSGGTVVIEQPKALAARLKAPKPQPTDDETSETAPKSTVGYRIQVFSDANVATAKNEAQMKERNILSRFPTLNTYITYNAPSWRLRVGDFKNREEAEEMMRELKNAFPSFSRELIIVRDRINLNYDK